MISSMPPIMKSGLINVAIKLWIGATAFVLPVQCQEDGRHYRIIKNTRFKVNEDMMELDGKRLNLLKVTEWRIACKKSLLKKCSDKCKTNLIIFLFLSYHNLMGIPISRIRL